MINNPYQKYQNQSVQTATPERLLLMLFEGAIRFCKEAMLGLEQQNFQLAHEKNIRVQNIINELIVTLNREQGGEVAENLLSIYQYLNQRLIEANLKKDRAILEEVLVHLTELHEAFSGAAQIVRAQVGRTGDQA
ncbi:flagellar export chaperone FliS [Tumebacillus lipolyticus]|uniref:Flagellar secretion chaperone FliS n=1 Tax=Tumebacillus lipolyticus TaxID=1280370 RepID=A0ABW4ZVR0_9BACL